MLVDVEAKLTEIAGEQHLPRSESLLFFFLGAGFGSQTLFFGMAEAKIRNIVCGS